MSTSELRAEDYETHSDTFHGWPVRITSYRIGQRYFASVDNVDPGAQVSRAEAATREDAVKTACDKARERLARTRRA
jgi:hypothetical protein